MGRKESLNQAKEIYADVLTDIINDKNKWKEFLDFSSRFYKYSFVENLLMFGQDKDVTMCATLEEWNSIGRWIKPHSKSLKILKDTENGVNLNYVFDVKDTYARKDIPNAFTDSKLEKFKWKATEEEIISILKDYFKYEDENNLTDIVMSYMATAIDQSGLLVNLSDEQEMEFIKPEFMNLLVNSTVYQVAKRCDIKIENEDTLFKDYDALANKTGINILGSCVSYCSTELLKIIEYKVKQIKKEEIKNGRTRQIWNDSKKEYERVIPNEVQRVDTRHNIDGKTISEGERNTRAESNNRETNKNTNTTTSNERIYSNGEIQSTNREYGGGTITANANRENLGNKSNEEVETTTSFIMPKKEISEELIKEILSEGSNVANSITRIKNILNDDSLTTKEQIIAIRNEYGDAGVHNDKYDWESRAKGLTITDNINNIEITLTWADVTKRLKQVLEIGNQQLGFESLINLSYKQDEIIEQEDNSQYDFIKDLIGKDITLGGREYKVDKLKIEDKEIQLYDKSIRGWFPIFRSMNLDEFITEYSKEHNVKQDEEEILDNKVNYKIKEDTQNRNAVQRANDNIKAIKLLKQIESENRYATSEEQEILAKYSGWGGLPKVFDTRAGDWQVQQIDARENLTEEELADAQASVLNSFYTNNTIIDSIYLGLARLGFKGGKILEPSARNR